MQVFDAANAMPYRLAGVAEARLLAMCRFSLPARHANRRIAVMPICVNRPSIFITTKPDLAAWILAGTAARIDDVSLRLRWQMELAEELRRHGTWSPHVAAAPGRQGPTVSADMARPIHIGP